MSKCSNGHERSIKYLGQVCPKCHIALEQRLKEAKEIIQAINNDCPHVYDYYSSCYYCDVNIDFVCTGDVATNYGNAELAGYVYHAVAQVDDAIRF